MNKKRLLALLTIIITSAGAIFYFGSLISEAVQPDSTITIVNNVINDNGGIHTVSDFPLLLNGNSVANGSVIGVFAGTYTVSEIGVAGYAVTFGGDCDANGQITTAFGDNLTCTITNDDQPAGITLNVNVINDNGGTATPNSFVLKIDGQPVESGLTKMVMSNIEHEIAEEQLSGYVFTGITGSQKCPLVLGGKVTLSEGEAITCTITNNDIASAPPAPVVDLKATLDSLNNQNFPFIFLNMRVADGSTPITDLTADNFKCTENGQSQDNFFQVTPPETGGGVRLADIVFLIDTSGSMGGAIAGVKNNVIAFADSLAASNVDYRLGLVQFGQYGYYGDPFLFNSGNLTSDVALFKNYVGSLSAGGGYEPSFQALRMAAQGFNFRPGSQKIFILITDEDSDDRDTAGTIQLMQANDIVVHVAANCSFDYSQADFCDATSVRGVTGGLLFNVQDPYDSVLDSIASQAASTYVLRYKSSNPSFDGTTREVACTVTNASQQQAIVNGSYIPGSAPDISLSEETKILNDTPLVENSTDAKIRVTVTDAVQPFVLTNGVRLYYRTSGNSNYNSLVMSKNGDIYEGVIPAIAIKGPGVNYYITATDGQVLSTLPTSDPSTNPFHIAVLPNVKPLIIHFPVKSSSKNNAITISATITDTTNRLSFAQLSYRHVGELIFHNTNMQKFGDIYSAEIPADFVTESIEYYIQAYDNFFIKSEFGSDESPLVIAVGEKLKYVALGDSFSSGFGLGHFLGSSNPYNECQRSLYAYPQLVAEDLNMQLDFHACAGATTEDFYFEYTDNENHSWGEIPQLDNLDDNTKLVTLSIGGNDAGFGRILQECMDGWEVLPGNSCHLDEKVNKEIEDALLRFDGGLGLPEYTEKTIIPYGNIFDDIKKSAPYADWVVVGYPHLFAETFAKCGAKYQVWINQQVDNVNKKIKAIAEANDILYAEPNFQGHELCGEKTEYIFDAFNFILNEIAAGAWNFITMQIEDWKIKGEGSLHPTTDGHEAIRDAILEVLGKKDQNKFKYKIFSSETFIYDFSVETDKKKFDIMSRWPGSDVEMTLKSPSGIIYGPNSGNATSHSKGDTWERYEVADPEPGIWKAMLFGADVAPEGEIVSIGVYQEDPPNQQPVGRISLNINEGILQLDGSTSEDYDGEIVSYEWSINSNQGEVILNGKLAQYNMAENFPRSVTLIVTDDLGLKDFTTENIDSLAPTTTPKITGIQGLNNWYQNTVTVALDVKDNIGGIGVEKTLYSLDNSLFQTYATATPIKITADGIHSLQFYSIDYFGNQEATNTIQIKIDKTAPEAIIGFNAYSTDLDIQGTDNLSKTKVTWVNDKTYMITDEAGNFTKLIFTKKKDKNRLIQAKLDSILYSNGGLYNLPKTSLTYTWDIFKSYVINQSIEVRPGFFAYANYIKPTNKTEIWASNMAKTVFNGLKIIKLATDRGLLGYRY
jgi:lysophospholipase L1-like esterase